MVAPRHCVGWTSAIDESQSIVTHHVKMLSLSDAALPVFLRGVGVKQILAPDKAACAIFLEQEYRKVAVGCQQYRLAVFP